MSTILLYPLRFNRSTGIALGGEALAHLLTAPLPGDGPIGEAWLLSDRIRPSQRVADGRSRADHAQLLEQSSEHEARDPNCGASRRRSRVRRSRMHTGSSVHSRRRRRGKTEAWVVLEAGPASRIYAGLKPAPPRRSAAGCSRPGRWRTFWPLHAESRRRRLHPAGTVHSSGPCGVRSAGKQRRHVFACTTGIASTPRQASLDLCKSSRRCLHRFRQVAIGPVAPVVERRRRYGESDSFIVNISRCGGSADNRRSQSARRTPRCWFASPAGAELRAQRHQLSRRPRRRRALAGGGRRMFLPAAQCRQLAGGRTAGIVPTSAGSGW